MKQIVAATELSQADRPVYVHAASMARATDAMLVLLNVDEVSRYGFHSSEELNLYLEQVARERTRRMELAAGELAEGGVEVQRVTLFGEAAEQIARYASAESADLVVMGRRGARDPTRAVLGHTAKRLLRRCGVPLMLVGDPGSGERALEQAPTYRRILAATDFSQPSERGLQATLELAERLDAQVDYVHVLRLPTPLPVIPSEPPLLVPRETTELLQHARAEELARSVQRFNSKRCRPSILIGSNVAETLAETARDFGDELITIPSHSHSRLREAIFGTTAEHVVKVSRLPVLVFPVHWLERNAPLPP